MTTLAAWRAARILRWLLWIVFFGYLFYLFNEGVSTHLPTSTDLTIFGFAIAATAMGFFEMAMRDKAKVPRRPRRK